MSCENHSNRTSSTSVGLHKPSNSVMHIDKARKGLNCDCICLDCGLALKAVIEFKNAGTKPYFQHHNPNNDNPCQFSGASKETELHFNLKIQVGKEKQVAVPPYYITRDCPYPGYRYKSFRAYSGRLLKFDEVLVESRAGSIIPDCIGVIGSYRVAIEIKVTHGVDDAKLEVFKSLGMDCVELYAPKRYISIPASEVINNKRNTEWLNYSKALRPDTLLLADKWFEQQKNIVEEKIARKKIMLQKADKELRPRRIDRLFVRLMQDWIDENLYYKPYREEELPTSFKSYLTSHGNGLSEFPFQEIESLKLLEQDLVDSERAVSALKYEYKEKRLELIRALSRRCHALVGSQGGDGQDLLYSLDSTAIFRLGLTEDEARNEERGILHQFCDDIDVQYTDKVKQEVFKKWKEKRESRGIGSANVLKVFETSPQFHSIKAITEKTLAGKQGVPSKEQVRTLIEEYLHIKAYSNKPPEVYEKEQKKLSKQLEYVNQELVKDLSAFISSVIFPYYLTKEDLKHNIYMLSHTSSQVTSLKSLLKIKHYNDFLSNQEAKRKEMIMKEADLMSRLNAYTDNDLKYLIKINELSECTT